LPSKLHKELQRAGLIVGIDVVYKGSRTNNKERRKRLNDLFHGDPNDSNNVSLVDHLYESTGCSTGLYEDVVRPRKWFVVVVVAQLVGFAHSK
jgi:hypothetical protein